jgi:hypothetical protein
VDPQEGATATKVAGFLEQLKQTTGIDAVKAIDRLGNGPIGGQLGAGE